LSLGEGEIEGLVGITLSDKTREYFKVDEALNNDPNQKYMWLSKKRLKLHIHTHEEVSEFHPFYDKIKVMMK